jgi:hypothetical protein
MLAVRDLPPCSSVVKALSTIASRIFALHSHIFCRMELLFSRTKPIPLYGLFISELGRQQITFTRKIHIHSCKYAPSEGIIHKCMPRVF